MAALLFVKLLRSQHNWIFVPNGGCADPTRLVALSLSDEDFGKLVGGKTQAQRLFMSGKLKVKGDVMKATKMEPILKKAQTKAML
jgi:putative sterol carrier protein